MSQIQRVDLSQEGFSDVFQCVDCGAYADRPEDVKHHASCIPGESAHWETFYEEESKIEQFEAKTGHAMLSGQCVNCGGIQSLGELTSMCPKKPLNKQLLGAIAAGLIDWRDGMWTERGRS